MPWGDRTGPMGMGPMTGRGMGYCAGFAGPGAARPGPGGALRGWGGGGGGRGFRNRAYAPGWGPWQGRGPGWGGRGAGRWGGYGAPWGYGADLAGDQEVAFLRNEAQRIEAMLASINRRLEELAAEGKTPSQ